METRVEERFSSNCSVSSRGSWKISVWCLFSWGRWIKCMKMYQLKYLFCFVKLSPSSPFMLNQAQNSKYNTTKEFKIMAELTHNTNWAIYCYILFLKLKLQNSLSHLYSWNLIQSFVEYCRLTFMPNFNILSESKILCLVLFCFFCCVAVRSCWWYLNWVACYAFVNINWRTIEELIICFQMSRKKIYFNKLETSNELFIMKIVRVWFNQTFH